ncbi:ABC transporter ATP-binding protein [Microbacterium marinilacus]|uniref:ABC transporter ATP-binding protein n=1 Tax=Microbacterium marinilacus TaxID=415209 RepID=A0ABP7BV47_9MICO|nr:ABC transporter ATP-binding protein [Microbacterium marinilacus]MBY0688095.1 ABC transporter ATP-binding protein [Microbacterium marinilacus]
MSLEHPPLLAADDVGFAYRAGTRPLISGFTESFERGSMSALVGPSGSGKSSLLFLMGLMLTPTSGTVLVDGRPASSTSDAERSRLRAEMYGFVFQDAGLDPRRSVIDNVLQPLAFRGESAEPWRERACTMLDDLGVEVPHDRRPGEVSGGQAQRIALCRALLADPAIILADEPTGNLDHDSADVVIARLRKHAEDGSAVLVVTHSREVEELCDRTIAIGTKGGS